MLTIGVYGFDEEGFFGALEAARVDTLCDIRRRRGVRGAEYAFANSTRLQERLAQMGIRYLHCDGLAPSLALRQRQAEADRAGRVAKRSRERLGPEFVAAYLEECLSGFDSAAFAAELPPTAERVAFLCVEREPDACHRSLVVERLQADLGLPVTHLRPPD